MTREEAIDVLKAYLMFDKSSKQVAKALNMAIESLSVANLKEEFESADAVPIQEVKLKDGFKIDDIPQDYEPTILGNVEVVVRCKDCKQRRVEGNCTHYYYCDFMGSMCGDNEYCSFGERRTL